MSKLKIDLNSDLGEAFSVYKMADDEGILSFISSANIACGFHAGDPCVMNKTVQLAKEKKVGIGAHPGFADLLGFGRRRMQLSFIEAKNYILYQLGALDAFARANKTKLSHIKAHGALYNMALSDEKLALALCEAVLDFDDELILLALSESLMIELAQKKGLCFANEFFADRAYNDDKSLVSRDIKGAVIEDEELALKRVLRLLKEGRVESISGKELSLKVDSICVHGDNPNALKLVSRLRRGLEEEGFELCSLKELVL